MNQPIQQGSIEMTDTRENESQVGRQDEEAPRRKQWKMPKIRKIINDRTEGKGAISDEEDNTYNRAPS
jgi:hypothetical protein